MVTPVAFPYVWSQSSQTLLTCPVQVQLPAHSQATGAAPSTVKQNIHAYNIQHRPANVWGIPQMHNIRSEMSTDTLPSVNRRRSRRIYGCSGESRRRHQMCLSTTKTPQMKIQQPVRNTLTFPFNNF